MPRYSYDTTNPDTLPFNKKPGSFHYCFCRMEATVFARADFKSSDGNITISEVVTNKIGDSPRKRIVSMNLNYDQLKQLGRLISMAIGKEELED